MEIMGIKVTDDEYCFVNSEIVKHYSTTWNQYNYNDRVEIVKDILLDKLINEH